VLFPPTETPVFLPKRTKRGHFLLSVRFFWRDGAVLDLDGVPLTEFSEITLFQAQNRKIEMPHPWNGEKTPLRRLRKRLWCGCQLVEDAATKEQT